MDAPAGNPERQPDYAIILLKRASEMIKVKQYDEALPLLNSSIEADASLLEPYGSEHLFFGRYAGTFLMNVLFAS